MKKLLALNVLIFALLLCAFSCGKSTQRLATASDAIAHALANADMAAQQAAAQGIISSSDQQAFHGELVRVASAGIVLNQAIRSGANNTTVAGETRTFLDAFQALNTTGIDGIKNQQLKLTIATILNGAETSVAVIEATVGK